MNWGVTEWVGVIACVITVGNAVGIALNWFLSGRYATKAELGGIKETLSTAHMLQGHETTRAHHRIDLLTEQVKGMPNYTHINELNAKFGAMATKLEVNTTKLDAMGEDIHQIRASVERIVDEIHRRQT